MRLRTKYAIVLLVILLVLGTVVGGSAELFKRQTIDQEQAELDETTRLAAGQVDAAVGGSSDFLFGYGTDIENLNDSDAILTQMLDNSAYFAVLVIDKNGTIVEFLGEINEQQRLDAIGTPATDLGYVEPEAIQRARNNSQEGQAYVGAPQPIEGTNITTMTFTTPIRRADDPDDTLGVLVGAVRFRDSGFDDALRPLETTTQTVRMTATTIDGERVTLTGADNSFDSTLQSRSTVESTGWTVTVERDRGALTGRIQFLQFIQLGSLAIVLLSVFGLGYYEYRTTLQQTDKLLDGFAQLTDGNFEYSLSLGSAEEWTQIGEGFNAMAEGMQEREQQIRERERRLSVLNRVLRHNLQNDLTVVQGYAEVLPGMDDREQREDASETILRKSRGLVDHGRKARRLETVMENAEEGTTELELGGKLLDTVAEYESEFPEVTVHAEGPDEAWVEAVSGVEFGIEQLVDNAFEHNTSDDPTVSVTIEQTDEDVVITVEDNGPGIPEHERDVLVQDEETSLEHGSGIGLWLAYWAVVKSGGDLAFDEQADGGHVTVRLPACDPPDDAGTGDLLDF